jgi:hypothetical protein
MSGMADIVQAAPSVRESIDCTDDADFSERMRGLSHKKDGALRRP